MAIVRRRKQVVHKASAIVEKLVMIFNTTTTTVVGVVNFVYQALSVRKAFAKLSSVQSVLVLMVVCVMESVFLLFLITTTVVGVVFCVRMVLRVKTECVKRTKRNELETLGHLMIRVAGSCVTLDSIVYSFQQGFTPEEIAIQFDTVELADIYATITYYLRHRSEVESYLRERQQQAQEIREENERRFPPDGIRARLLARRQAQGA